jgi:hypothetical protein
MEENGGNVDAGVSPSRKKKSLARMTSKLLSSHAHQVD